jgi:hypothetical protein
MIWRSGYWYKGCYSEGVTRDRKAIWVVDEFDRASFRTPYVVMKLAKYFLVPWLVIWVLKENFNLFRLLTRPLIVPAEGLRDIVNRHVLKYRAGKLSIQLQFSEAKTHNSRDWY